MVTEDIEIEVFKTNVTLPEQADKVLMMLVAYFPEGSFNFDLEDGDCILRAKGMHMQQQAPVIIGLVKAIGHQIEVLPE